MIAMVSIATSGTSTPQQTSSVEEVFSNDDLLIQILHPLPNKSVLKLKSVSKHWLSLISSPHFSRLRYPNPLSGLVLPISTAIDLPNYKFVPLDGSRPSIPPSFMSGVTMLQSCNGFFLCCSPNQQMYFILNPTTEQRTPLPQLLDDQVSHPVVAVGLAFDPSKSLHHKVVCVRKYNSVMPDRYRIEIYSSESGSWRQSGDVFTAPNHKFNHAVFWNGAIHWINNFWTMKIGDLGTILRFDVNEEKFLEMPMPEIPDGWNQVRIRYFGESRNHLNLILLEGPCVLRFNVYEMKKDYSRWFLKHQVDLDSVITTAFPEVRHWILDPANLIYYNFSILCLGHGENDEDSFLVMCVPGKVICYCLKDGTFTKLCDLGFPCSRRQCAYQYIESLVCVK